MIRRGAGGHPARIALKLMNARHGEPFQVEMVEAAGRRRRAGLLQPALVGARRHAAYGGYDLSDRNLRALEAVEDREMRRPPLSGTGNVSSGRMILEYAKLGCESVQLHTFFQLPLSEYPATAGSRTQRALHALVFHPESGLIAGLLDLEHAGRLHRRGRRASLPRRDRFLMRITRVELLELTLPLVEPFVISGGTMRERRSLVVVLHDETGHRGYGESPPFELPFYSDETTASARYMLEQVLIPRVLGAEFDSPEARGRRAATRRARQQFRPGRDRDRGVGSRGSPPEGRARRAARRAARRRAGGGGSLRRGARHSGGSLGGHLTALGRGRGRGRLSPGEDQGRARLGRGAGPGRARAAMAGTDLPLTVDANGGYEWPEHERALRALDEAGLLYIEQPLHPDELVGHARLAERLTTQVCVDETLRDARAARQIAELGGPLVWNVKVHRVGGLSEVCRIVRGGPGAAARSSGPGPCRSPDSARRPRSPPRRCRGSSIRRISSPAPGGSAETPTSSSSP